MLHLTFVLMALFGVAPDATADLSLTEPAVMMSASETLSSEMTVASTAASTDLAATEILLPSDGLRIFLPLPSIEVCDEYQQAQCPPGCGCAVVAGQVRCLCP